MSRLNVKEYQEGREANGRAYVDECPYPDGSAEYNAWHDGYCDKDIENELKRERREKRK